jgi:hypothetical protein
LGAYCNNERCASRRSVCPGQGICSFSGLSVWYLDHGTAPFSHADWVDHIKPKSRSGKNTQDNLVCASYFYNRKKLNNGFDCQYLFHAGKPTDVFFETHGELSIQQAKLLAAHAALEPHDWYFNRAIFNVMVAIGNELSDANAVRTREYWLASARKRMAAWKRKTAGNSHSFAKRGLVRYPKAIDVQLMLSLAEAPEGRWPKIYRALLALTRANDLVFSRFLNANNRQRRLEVIARAEARGQATPPLIDVLKKNAARL